MADGVKKINEWIMKDGRTITVTRTIDPNKLEGGTQFINPNTGLLNYVSVSNTGAREWKKFDPVVIFNSESIKTNLIADGSLITSKYANLSITAEKIADLNVTTNKLNDLSVTAEKLANSSVINSKIANNAITRTKILDFEVTLSKLAEGSVNADKIVPQSIVNANIANQTITKSKIAPKTLSNEEIANDTLIESLYAEGSVSSRALKDRSVTSTKIELRNVLRGHIFGKAIGSAEIDDSVISTNHINAISGIKLIDKTIAETKLEDGSISNRTLANLSVSYDKLDSNLKDLVDRSIRVDKEQNIGNDKHIDTAWVKGNLVIKKPTSGNANLSVYGDITSTGTVTATKCYNPVFADLAEAYIPTEKLLPGDAVALSLDGELKVEKLNAENQDRFIGFVSDEYATVFGASEDELRSGKKIAITLIGRIKIKAINSEAKIGNYVYIVNGKIEFYPQRAVSAVGRVLENKIKTDDFVLCQLWP